MRGLRPANPPSITTPSAIYKGQPGIPRRISQLCDRLLLLGFMQGRTPLTLEDVKAVLKDIAQESAIPKPSGVGAGLQAGALGRGEWWRAQRAWRALDINRLQLVPPRCRACPADRGFERRPSDRLQRLGAA